MGGEGTSSRLGLGMSLGGERWMECVRGEVERGERPPASAESV